MGIVGMCVNKNTVALDKVRAFVAGYERLRPLTPPKKNTSNYSLITQQRQPQAGDIGNISSTHLIHKRQKNRGKWPPLPIM